MVPRRKIESPTRIVKALTAVVSSFSGARLRKRLKNAVPNDKRIKKNRPTMMVLTSTYEAPPGAW